MDHRLPSDTVGLSVVEKFQSGMAGEYVTSNCFSSSVIQYFRLSAFQPFIIWVSGNRKDQTIASGNSPGRAPLFVTTHPCPIASDGLARRWNGRSKTPARPATEACWATH